MEWEDPRRNVRMPDRPAAAGAIEQTQMLRNYGSRIAGMISGGVKEGVPGDGPEIISKTPSPNSQGPALLLMSFPYATVPELLTVLPERRIADRLITRFFQSKEPVWMIFHFPTFLKEYDAFWFTPEQSSLSWLALLFIMVGHSARSLLRSDEEIPYVLGKPLDCDTYRIRAAQCLALDDYTKPGKHKMETLLLYFWSEYLREQDGGVGVGTSILLSLVVRFGMHMRLHLDPKHYKCFTPFEGEIRRRLWAVLWEFDVLVSFQFGLHPSTQLKFFDTEPPSNLLDQDFDLETAVLPASRDENVRSPTLYTIVKRRILAVFSDICGSIAARKITDYTEVQALDARLLAAYESIPSILRYDPLNKIVTDPPDLIMQRYWLDLLYHKARTVLHREYLGSARLNPERYGKSREKCLEAAMATMWHQWHIDDETQQGGRLAKERWVLGSLSTHDFLLAAMILCLELSSHTTRDKKSGSSRASDVSTTGQKQLVVPKTRLVEYLQTSLSIWETLRRGSAEADRACKILTTMWTASAGSDYESFPELSGKASHPANSDHQPTYSAGNQSVHSTGSVQSFSPAFSLSGMTVAAGGEPSTESSSTIATSPSSVPSWSYSGTTPSPSTGSGPSSSTTISINSLIDPDLNTGPDWCHWDCQIHNSSAEALQIPWETFFQSC